MSEILLPSLGAEMEEGTLLEWYVKPGDVVVYGQVVALLDTEKAEIEMETFEAGTVEALLVEPGETIPVGTPMARLRAAEPGRVATREREPVAAATGVLETPAVPIAPQPETVPAPSAPSAPSALPALPALPAPPVSRERAARPEPNLPSKRRATPLARRLAAERGIDLASLTGSGPHGAIVGEDVPSAAARATEEAPREDGPAATRALRRREIIAAAMERSKREIPHYYLATPIEIQPALDWVAAHNAARPPRERILLPALLMKAVARAACEVPEMNGHWRDGRFHASVAVHLGMVVSLRGGGIVVPTFRDAALRPLGDLMAELGDVVARARAGRLRSSELSEATLTVTSLGDRGAESIFGIIYPPQVAIVGIGGVHPRLVSEGSLIGARAAVQVSLAADHRASDGQRGSRFLAAIERALHAPEGL